MAGSTSYDAISRKIYKAIIHDDWDSVKEIFQAHPERLYSIISLYNETPLYVAVGTNRSHHFVRNLVNQIMLEENGLEKLRTPSTSDNYNALHEAARCDNITDARLLVTKDSQMPNIVECDGETPLEVASWVGNEEMIRYLMSVTGKNPFGGIHGASILANIINSGLYDLALDLVKEHPHLVTEVNDYRIEETALGVLAAQENAFPSVTKLGFVKRLIYSQIPLNLKKSVDSNPVQDQVDVDIEDGRRSRLTDCLSFLQTCFGKVIPLKLKKPVDSNPVQDQVNVDIEDGRRSRLTDCLSFLQTFFGKGSLAFWNVFSYLVPCIKHIRDIKLRHLQAKQLLKEILLVLLQHENGINVPIIGSAIQIAIAHGSHELVEECVKNHPEVIWYIQPIKGTPRERRKKNSHGERLREISQGEGPKEEVARGEGPNKDGDRREEEGVNKEGCREDGHNKEVKASDNEGSRDQEGPREDEVSIKEISPSKETPSTREGYDLFESAIIHRREKVFSLMYQISAQRSWILSGVGGENALHLVGKLAPYDRLSAVTGVALQMQRELLWFKEVEKFTDPVERRELNNEDKTPRMVFTDEHKQLLKDAQQWTKDTASSSTVVASLLITITFAAMFTVPGGNNDVGKSFFARDRVFLLFVISDAMALFSSSTSVLMFLSTLTRSSQEDFLYALPLRLTLGLISLFISLATTMVAFSATLVLVLRDEIRWIAGPVTLLASVPGFLFLFLQYPLLQELLGATFGRSIFRKRSNVLLH